MSTNKIDDKSVPKKDTSNDAALKLLVSILEARGIIKAHQAEAILKELK